MVVRETRVGNTVIRIHDDQMAKTPEERQKVLDEITKLIQDRYMYRQKEETA